jgi:hypothetical protein
MRLILEDKSKIYQRLDKPTADPANLAIASMLSQTTGEGYDNSTTLEGVEKRTRSSVRGLSASLPSPLDEALMQFVRNGDRYIGVINLLFEEGASFSHFSDFLGNRFNGNEKYLWIPTKDFGFGYFNNFTVNDLNPVASVDGSNSMRCSVRSIWVGDSGAATRVFDEESFETGFRELGNLADQYINAYLDYCSKGVKPAGRKSLLKRKKRFTNPSDLIVKLSAA